MVNQLGYDSDGNSCTPLIEAAWNELTNIVECLLQHDADVSITHSSGCNALHFAADYNKTNTNIIQLLLNKMSLNDINHINNYGNTPLDLCYGSNYRSIQQDIITLIRKHDGKANKYDINGNHVREGNGDLNGEERATLVNLCVRGSTSNDLELLRQTLATIPATDINKKDNYGYTPWDRCYYFNNSSIKQDIITLIRKHGGKANRHDKNGNRVGEGNGDLNN